MTSPPNRPQKFLRDDEVTYKCAVCLDTGFESFNKPSVTFHERMAAYVRPCRCEKGDAIARGMRKWETGSLMKASRCQVCRGTGIDANSGDACACRLGKALAQLERKRRKP